ncbi:MAG: GNAT family N-acetyltransferase [Alphaproteobacteria bacterium]|nr:GNAT family N-acetyltransferase [Alphaproteobacteria bacterium]
MFMIRRGQPRDAEVIARMVAEASREDGRPAPALDADLVRAHGFGATAMFESWVAEGKGGAIVACAIATKGYDIDVGCATLVVAALYVAPEGRRDGLARAMIAEIAARAMDIGARELVITTGVDNSVARRFFAAVGALEQTHKTFLLGRDQIEWLAQERA